MGILGRWPCDRRQLRPEMMDAPSVDPAELRRSLAYIRRVNRLLGYTRATLSHVQRFSRAWQPGHNGLSPRVRAWPILQPASMPSCS